VRVVPATVPCRITILAIKRMSSVVWRLANGTSGVDSAVFTELLDIAATWAPEKTITFTGAGCLYQRVGCGHC